VCPLKTTASWPMVAFQTFTVVLTAAHDQLTVGPPPTLIADDELPPGFLIAVADLLHGKSVAFARDED
jgi:hypothetical protein